MNITILSLNQSPKKNSFLIFFLIFLLLVQCGVELLSAGAPDEKDSWVRARQRMVERDLRGRGIKDPRVLEAMSSVPRHLFVPRSQEAFAYDDRPLPIGDGQTISQPYIVALMTELLELQGNEKVLEIGTGSGYQAAVLGYLVREVYTIEILAALSEAARERLAALGYKNIWVKTGDGFFGWEEKAPFDAILVTAAAEKVPEPLWQQLQEGGTLVMPLGSERRGQRLVRLRKRAGKRHLEEITGVLFVPMTGAVRKEDR